MAATTTASTETFTIESDVLGDITVGSDQLVHFDDGLLGFPETRSYVLVPAGREGTYWLQSAEHASLIFLLVDPFVFFPDYAVELAPSEVESIRARSGSDVAVFAIVTLPGSEGEPPTANLQGPVAMNLEAGVARQIILRRPDLGVRRAFSLEEDE